MSNLQKNNGCAGAFGVLAIFAFVGFIIWNIIYSNTSYSTHKDFEGIFQFIGIAILIIGGIAGTIIAFILALCNLVK